MILDLIAMVALLYMLVGAISVLLVTGVTIPHSAADLTREDLLVMYVMMMTWPLLLIHLFSTDRNR